MLADKETSNRLGVFAELSDQAGSRFGRTALMKLCFFLQTLRSVPLGYEFSLYSYGPFDSEVLQDLRLAENLSILESSVNTFSGGYQYQIGTSDNAALAKRSAREFINVHKTSITWVAQTFGSRSASELELLSTIIFVDREREHLSQTILRDKVKAVKPHFSEAEITAKILWLKEQELLMNRI